MIGDNRAATVTFSLALVVLLLVALYTNQIDELQGERDQLLISRRRRHLIGWFLAGLAIAERLLQMVFTSHLLDIVGSIGWLLFFGFIALSQLGNLLKHKDITGETISLSISIYLLLGLTWGLLYIFIFMVQPHAFSFGTGPEPTIGVDPHTFSVLVYFSLTTIATIGYGDITPLTLQARYAAVAEGIFGQFYLAVLVARLVGMHMSQRASSRDLSD